jgi:hypothetical protein
VYQLEQVKTKRADALAIKRTAELVVAIGQRNAESDRADTAEQALKPTQDEVARLRGRTWAGRLIRKGRDGLAVVGGVVILIGIASTAR